MKEELLKGLTDEQIAKIKACKVEASGNFVSLIVSSDAEAMTKLYQAAFK